ncbi:MAG TPA: hypothetical protein VE010_06070, partial [Thermoanaerobaculia bacterium]|nr:hypothetical protein [Thermoanaerobaculia bacterium]
MILTTALVLELVRHSLTGSHCRYRQYVNEIPTDVYVTRPCDANTLAADALRPATAAAASQLRIVNGRTVRREIVEEKPLQPFAYDYDVESGALMQRIPLFFQAGPARVFDPNPVVALNDPTLQDRNDSASAVPEAAYKYVDVDLNGPHVRIIDRQAPNVPPADPNGSLLFNREESGFEDVNASFHVDRTQRYLQSLGYSGERAIVPYAIEVDTHAVNGDDNSFFLPSQTRIGFGALLFGEGGTDDAEDADLVVHEYTHAMLEWIAPGTFFGTFASESRA